MAGALTVPGMVRRVREVIDQQRRVDRDRQSAIDSFYEEVQTLGTAVDDLSEDLDKLIGVVAGAVLDLNAPASAPLAALVESRTGPRATIVEIEAIFTEQRAIAKAKRLEARRAEEEAAGTNLRCPECDAVRGDYAEWFRNKGAEKDKPTCPDCGSDREPEAPNEQA